MKKFIQLVNPFVTASFSPAAPENRSSAAERGALYRSPRIGQLLFEEKIDDHP
jgi:hypothetical protein